MSKNTKVYNSDEVLLTVGTIIDSGFADDEFIRIEQESDDVDDVVGVDGEVSISRTNDRRADVRVLVMSTSDGNDVLSALSTLARNAPGMAGAVVPFMVKDLNGRSLYAATNCWVKKPPDRSFARVPGTNEWLVRVAHLDRNDGGNANITS